MPVTNVRSRWLDGKLYFETLAGLEVFHIDGPNRAFVMADGTTITLPSGVGLNLLLDGVKLTLGTDSDAALVNRATVLNANTTLTGVIVGTPVTPAVAANSLIISDITADGDILLVTQTGGHSHAAMWVDASAGITRLYSGAGVEVLKLDSAALTATGSLLVTGLLTSAGWRNSGAGHFGFGTGEAVTIATGVATVTKPYVILDAEGAGTTDQLDSITYTGVADGDLLLLVPNATDTITVDDANINLAAATRALAPGGSLLLRYDGTEAQWTEVQFTAAADNV
jgi:hypothetical protein